MDLICFLILSYKTAILSIIFKKFSGKGIATDTFLPPIQDHEYEFDIRAALAYRALANLLI